MPESHSELGLSGGCKGLTTTRPFSTTVQLLTILLLWLTGTSWHWFW
ncbi:MAG: hypothetical protein V7K14_13305 [Nostoc sp.]